MSRLKLVICDADKFYCRRLDEYLRSHLNLAFDIYSFTDTEKLEEFAEKENVILLIISENQYYELNKKTMNERYKNLIILDEENRYMVAEEGFSNSNVAHISKYQSAGELTQNVLEFCTRIPGDFDGISTKVKLGNSKIVGFYTPISRSGQTTLSIEVSKALSEKKRTLFMSLESFSDLSSLLGDKPDEDLSDLMYYAECETKKICLYLERIKGSYGSLDYIAPSKTSMQVKEISYEKLRDLLELLSKEAGYEYIVLDLTDYPSGFFDILRMCNSLITIVRDDFFDMAKVRNYEDVLRQNGYEDVVLKAAKFKLPEGINGSPYKKAVRDILNKEILEDEK